MNQIDPNAVQARVSGTCTGGGAIGSITSAGKVQCVSTPPLEFGISSGQVTLGSGSTQIASTSLPGGSLYLVFALAHATVTGSATGQWVRVSCTLAPGGNGNAVTESGTVHVSADPEVANIPITLPAPAVTGTTTASVSCSVTHPTGSAPTVAVAATMNALQTASNT